LTKSAKKKTAPPKPSNGIILDIAGMFAIALALIGLAGVIYGTVGSIGTVGLLIKKGFQMLAGSGYVMLLLLLIPIGLKLMSRNRWRVNSRFWGLLVLFGSLQIFLHRQIPMSQSFSAGLAGQGGGLSGATLSYALKYCFGTVGTYVFIILFVLLGISLCTQGSIKELVFKSWFRTRTAVTSLSSATVNFLFTEVDGTEQPATAKELAEEYTPPVIEVSRPSHVLTEPAGDKEEAESAVLSTLLPPEDLPTLQAKATAEGQQYLLPPLSLLDPVPNRADNQSGKDVNQRIKVLEQVLDSFGIKARVTHVSVGPSITRYELQPPPGVKVSKIVGLSDDIALGMASAGVRIEAPIPGKAAVGIEVPNGETAAVALRELLEDKAFAGSPSKLTIALGKDIAGAAVTADLSKMPHLLIAGATGSGKSVCVNTIICSILYKATPGEVKFLMVDPKMVELTSYNGIPHLVSPVVTNAKKAAGALRWAVREMETRYDLFAAAGVRDITRYNALFGEFEQEPGQTPLPYIVVIIDELADLMMVAPADVEDAICRLAQMARAAGIHLVVATQRPSVDVITGLIKANIPSRISFAVSSQTDSRTILDMGGAEKLLGKGDMLFYPVGASKPVRVQGAFISDKDVENLVDFLKDQARPVYNEAVLEAQPDGDVLPIVDCDDLLPQAAKIFIESGTASISMLQRRLHIGYSRAARLVDIMEQRGIVGGFEGSKPRAVLMTMELYHQVFESQETSQEAKTAVL